MKRNYFLWMAAALAVVVSLPSYPSRVTAQQTNTSTDDRANQSTEQNSSGTQNTTDTQQSSSVPPPETPSTGNATNQSNAQPQQPQQESSTTTNAGNNQRADAQSTNNGPATQSNAQSSTARDSNNYSPSAAKDASATQGTSARTKTNDRQASQGSLQSPPAPSRSDDRGPQPQDRSLLNQDQRAMQRNAATDRTRAGADVTVQGKANVDARSQRQQLDIRSGIQFGRATDRGLIINTVEDNSVFFRNGFRRGDVLVSLHGRPIRTENDFMQWIVQYPGERIPVVVLRDGVQQTIYVEYPGEPVQRQQVYADRPVGVPAYLGVFFDTQIRDGVIVRGVTPGTPAEQADLQPGDAIVALNGAQVMSYPEAISMIRSMQPGERLEILVQRGRTQQQIQAVLAGQPSQPVRTATRDIDVYRNPQVVPAPPQDQRNYIDRGYYDGRYRDRERPLRRRLFE